MAGNKPSVKIQRTKARSAASVSPAQSQLSDDATNNSPDLSILRKSIATSITGFAQAREVFDNGTSEIKQLLSNECDIIYECRVCRNLFRSLANFISHKRIYCCETFKSSVHPHFNNNNFMKDDIIAIIQHEEEYQDFVKNKNKMNCKNGISIDSFGKKNTSPKDLTSIIEKLIFRNENSKQCANSGNVESPNKIHARLQPIPDTKIAMYQNIYCDKKVPRDFIKNEIAELDRLISSNEAVLGPDGKLISRNISPISATNISNQGDENNTNKQEDLFCNICKINFSTQKTLKFHMKHKHAENRLVYPCPDCTDTFSNSWSVFRHLFKVHRKSATHIRKLRESIQNKAFKLHIASIENLKAAETPANSISEQQRVNQENQAWIDNLEGDGDIPRCGGCGKRFERRAALSSHRQTCQLRKSAQNKLNSNLQRKLVNKSTLKDVDDTILSEPSPKISKIEKPLEKRIEIKIRKDYIKTSPVNVRTSSPADEDSTVESMEHSDTTNLGYSIGESECNFVNSLDKTYFNEYSNTETVKDCDDANVDGNFERNSSDTNNSIDINEDSNFIDDSELNFDDIKRICHDENEKVDSKAYGQNEQSSLTESNLSIKIECEDILSDKSLDGEINDVGNDFCVKTENQECEFENYQCDYCPSIFIEKYRLEKHITRHMIWIKFECKICGIKSCNATQYKRHMKQQHEYLHSTKKKQIKKARNNSLEGKKNFPLKYENIDYADLENSDFNDLNLKVENQTSERNVIKTKDNVSVNNDSNSLLKVCKSKNDKMIKKKPGSIKRSQEKKKNSLSLESSKFSNSTPSKIVDNESYENIETEVSLHDNNDSVINMEDLVPLSTSLKSRNVHKKYFETDIPEDNFKKHNQHIASSESYTVRRPVRNRIKNIDKDFEYDSSYLPKVKVDHKETSIVRILSEKPVLKRKQFLQNEIENEKAVDISHSEETSQMNRKEEIVQMNQTEETSRTNLKEETRQMIPREATRQTNLKEETPIQKLHQGALQTISLRVASQGKAMMKQKQQIVTRRYTPPFIRTSYRMPITMLETRKSTESFIPIHPLPVSQHGAMRKKTVPLVKTTQLKYLQIPSTASKTSEKSFSERIRQKTGISALSPQKTISSPKKETPLTSPQLKKKKIAQQQQTLPTKVKNVLKFDHEALSSENSSINEEVTMITKPNYKKNLLDKELDFSENTLSILPANGKTKSDFVNISLKELKDLQKDKNKTPSFEVVKNVLPKNISVLKNLEENNEIKISKVRHGNKKDDLIESRDEQSIEIIDVSEKQSQSMNTCEIINIKNTFPHNYITSILTIDDDVDIDETEMISSHSSES